METKEDIRKKVKEITGSLTREVMDELSRRTMSRLEMNPKFGEARTVAIFHSLADEPDTRPFVEKWSAEGKTIALPCVEGKEIVFRRYSPETLAEKGRFNIAEPKGGRVVEPHEIDLMVVPGVAFDHAGNRMGRGGGYYDRFLAGLEIYRIGVCFPHQLLAEIPCEPHDVPMDEVVTAD